MSDPEKMQAFNIALRPVVPSVASSVVSLVSPYADSADQYILGPNALPHVTICQFRAPDAEEANWAFKTWAGRRDFPVELANLKLTPGGGPSAGKFWVAIHTVREATLMEMQAECRQHLLDRGLQALTSSESYDPHFTLMRSHQAVSPVVPRELSPGRIIPCYLDLGHCNENGVFLRPVNLNAGRPVAQPQLSP